MNSKLPHVGTTIFTTMSKMALDYNAINLAQGFPNFPIEDKIVELIKVKSTENIHQYAPLAGNPMLIEQIVKLCKTSYNRSINSSEVLITAGATQAIFTTIQALVFPEDEVIIIDPAYDCYAPAVELVNGKCVHIAMEDDYSIDWNKIEKAINAKTKLIIINNPHNPSAKILTSQDIGALSVILDKNQHVFLLSDEVYEYISFEKQHISINTIEKLRDRSIIVSSFGKTFHITGWKTGYLIAPEHIMQEIKKVHQYLVFCVNSTAQHILSDYLNEVDVNQLANFYQKKRDYFQELLKNSRFNLLPSEGSYFQLADYSAISNENDVVFCENLVKQHGVAAIPMSVFYKDKIDRKVIRLCFAKTEETLIQAAEKLCKI